MKRFECCVLYLTVASCVVIWSLVDFSPKRQWLGIEVIASVMQAPEKQISVKLLLFQPVSGLLAQEQTQKLRQEVVGVWLQIRRPLKLQRKKHIPFWFCKIKINPNQPYHQHLIQHWFNHMLQNHHIGSLNLWFNNICNKLITSSFPHCSKLNQTVRTSFYVEDRKGTIMEQSRNCRLEFITKCRTGRRLNSGIAESWDFNGNGFNNTSRRTKSFGNPFKSQIFTCRDRWPADLKYSSKSCHKLVLPKVVYTKERLQWGTRRNAEK